jgi:uncharacterized protein (DUF2062 family)/SAM-dependent methyltransferase
MPRRPGRLARRFFQHLRLEYPGPNRDAAAIGVGAFIGCLPFFGFHLLLTTMVGRVLHLNRLKIYAAANLSNPVMAPFLIFAEVQTGAWLRRRDAHDLTVEAIRQMDPWSLGGDLLLGSVCVGAVIGTMLTLATIAAIRPARPLPPAIDAVFAAAADRYIDTTMTAWEFARGKLRGDGVYAALFTGILPSGPVFADVGCGQGLTLASLIEARRLYQPGAWPYQTPPPAFDRVIGIEMRRRVAAIARDALDGDAEIIHASAPEGLPPAVSAAALFDVLHLAPPEDQEALLVAIGSRMASGAVLLVREADSDTPKGFLRVRVGNRIKAIAVGRWTQRFYFRGVREWTALFSRLGWQVEMPAISNAAGFANVLFRLTKI